MARHPSPPRRSADDPRQLSWYLFFRGVIVTLFLGGTIVYHLRGGTAFAPSRPPFLYLLVGLSYLQMLGSAAALPQVRRYRLFVQCQLVYDLLLASLIIYVTGGTESPFSFLYIFIIISAGVFLARRDILFVASASCILYGSLLDLQYYDLLPQLPGLLMPEVYSGQDVFFDVFINVTGFLLTALLASNLSERYRRSEQALEKKEIDFEELEQLNRTILGNVTSGLMIINATGRIRSFNDAASRITGHALGDIYNRDIREVFPKFLVLDGSGFRIVSRDEAILIDAEGRVRTLGYSSSLVKDPQEQTLGLLVTFQDLTHLKEMEDQLKRADRLAAVGRLASGLAHEIRNPLASISGSVQLLMEGQDVTAADRRLMEIVVKEADRLSRLLSDFLNFARPAVPDAKEFDLALVLDDLADAIASDPRFSEVEVRRAYRPGTVVCSDQGQIYQALLNLAINGAEAMAGQGVLLLGVDPGKESVYVEDAGPGIKKGFQGKVFEPFFTTKDKGTGLGLATVYAIIDAHGGTISLGEGELGGARFNIQLPGRFGPCKGC